MVAAKDAALLGSRWLRRLGVGAVAGGRLVRWLVRLQPLDLVDQEQDRAARRLELGLRLVVGELLSPAAEFVYLSCIHAQSMTVCRVRPRSKGARRGRS